MKHLGRILVVVAVLLAAVATEWAQPVTNPRVVTVSPDGSGASFSSIGAALNSITTASASNPFVILAYPGIYTGSNNVGLTWKSWVSLRGVERASTIVRGSTPSNFVIPLIDASDRQEVEISNITLDGSAQVAEFGYDENGSTLVCGATITFNDVTYVTTPGVIAVLSSNPQAAVGQTCTQTANVTVRNSEVGLIADFGGNWLITNSRVRASEIAYIRTGGLISFPGTASFVGSTVEATGPGSVIAIYDVASATHGAIRITGSKLIARSTVSSPASNASVLLPAGSTPSYLIEGSTLIYESVNGATSGQYYGINAAGVTNASTIEVRNSAIRSVGTGGTRADVFRDTGGAAVSLAGVDYSTVSGTGTGAITTANFRQATYSADLTIPVTGPTASTPVDGQVWVVPAQNQLCYRSSGATRCVTGTSPGTFMKVSKVGSTSGPGDLLCVNQGGNRKGRAVVTVLNRDTLAPIASATVTGNWSGATTQNGVTAVTDSSGNATFTSNTAPPGSVFTFTVTNVTHAPDSYDPASNNETSDSTPVCN